MKIKTWLMLAFLIVMFLPIVCAYGFYILVQEWDESRRLVDTFELTEQIQSIESQLQLTDLYHVKPLEDFENQLSSDVIHNENVTTKLYRADGVRVYHSDSDNHYMQQVDRSLLMKNLYQYDLSYDHLSVKKPVFDGETMVGVYDIDLARTEWVEGVESRRTMMIGMAVGLLILLYLALLWLLHRKLNRPLKDLMNGMSVFATKHKTVRFDHKKNDEIGQLMKHFEQMQEQIEASQKLAQKEQEEKQLMMASFSHDIKTPLTSLQTYAEALEEDEDEALTGEEKREYLQIIKNKTNHLKGLVDDLTTYAKLQSAQYEMELTEVDADEFFEMIFEGYDEIARQKNIRLLKQISINGHCEMNAQQMVRFVDNLMSNALRYTPGRRLIGMAVIGKEHELPDWIFPEIKKDVEAFSEDQAVLIVQNEGPSINDSQLNSILTPFYQIDDARTTDRDKNSGLGLSIAKMIADKHGGEMNIMSAEQGTLVMMRFNQM
ncbi:sensor histidine kinase [Tenuibacillus multivorans]|uniref:histidine kinase n=1 Tax=Tenuibacillus multivorans TaxID=237069 RepID=A0A1H0BU01_9BACI|nr:HAMP domain-containing sensor histidine kinase [Tenuibacillus multivorans]GEL77036.1 hypothetical protein TMU01_12710 [Tenuibacillus multivorans]SDN49077.1 Signal transduction histidine kinase [Tenuibacillus multivorans]